VADTHVVLHVAHAGDALGDVLGPAPGVAVVDRTAQRHLAVVDIDVDLRGIDVGVIRQPVVDVLLDALVGAPVAFRAAAAIVLLPTLLRTAIAEPRRDLVGGALEESAVLLPPTAAAVALAAIAAATVATAAVAAAAAAAVVAAVAEAAPLVADEAPARSLLAEVLATVAAAC